MYWFTSFFVNYRVGAGDTGLYNGSRAQLIKRLQKGGLIPILITEITEEEYISLSEVTRVIKECE